MSGMVTLPARTLREKALLSVAKSPVVIPGQQSGGNGEPTPEVDCTNAPTSAQTKDEILTWLEGTGVTFDSTPSMAMTKDELLGLVGSLCN